MSIAKGDVDVKPLKEPTEYGYDYGWCTYGAAKRAAETEWTRFPKDLGDGGQWDNTAHDRYRLETDRIPRGGAIVVWEARVRPKIGHVGFVEEVLENGSFKTTEWNACDQKPEDIEAGIPTCPWETRHTYSPPSPDGNDGMSFIYPPYPIVYEHANYAGAWEPVKGYEPDFDGTYTRPYSYPEGNGVALNDSASSIWVPPNLSLILYKDASYSCPAWDGISESVLDFADNHYFSDGSPANDGVSSIKTSNFACLFSGCMSGMTLGANSVGEQLISTSSLSDKISAQSTSGICGAGPTNPNPPPDVPSQPDSTQWQVSYYNNEGISGSTVWSGTDGSAGINHNWGTGSPASGVNANHWSARWERDVFFNEAGDWKFTIKSDDGFRLFIDGELFAHEWWEGWHDISPTKSLSAGVHRLRLDYFDATGSAQVSLSWEEPPIQDGTYYGNWYAEWFDWTDLDPNKLVSTSWEDTINYNWETGSPGHGLGTDHFSVRWTGTFNFPTSGFYKFPIRSDDGFKLWIDGELVAQEWWWEGGEHEMQPDRYLSAGDHEVKFEYFENEGHAKAQLSWWKFPDDTTLPTGEVVQPVVDTALNANQIKICAQLDDGDGIGLDNVQFHLYHPAQSDSWQYIETDSDGRDGWCTTWDHSSWPDEEVNTHLFAWDRAGNMFSGGGNTFQIDRTAPTGSFTSPTSDLTVTGDTLDVSVNANDNLSGVDRIEFQAYYDAGNNNPGWWPLLVDSDGNNGWGFTWDFADLPAQQITLRATIVDKAGNIHITTVDNVSLNPLTPDVWVGAAWTADGNWNSKTAFDPGDPIQWVLSVNNTTGGSALIELTYDVRGPNGKEVMYWNGTVTTEDGTWFWALDGTIPSDMGGTHTFNGLGSYQVGLSQQDNSSQEETTYFVTGPAPILTPTPTPTPISAAPPTPVPTPVTTAGQQIYLPIVLK